MVKYKNFLFDSDFPFTVTTATYDYIPDELKQLFDLVAKGAKNRNENYLPENSFTNYTLCYSLTLIDDEPYLGSVAWARKLYNGFVRLGTRYCVNPTWSRCFYKGVVNGLRSPRAAAPGKGFDNLRVDFVDHIDQQYDFCMKKGYENFFISREDKTKSALNTRRICESLNKYSKYSWKMLDEKQRVAPNPVTGWQYIIYNKRPYEKQF